MTDITAPTWPRFPSETLRRLFDAVAVDDVVDAPAVLPDAIVVDCTDEEMRRCYALCLQFWEDGASRRDLLRLVGKLLKNDRLTADERLQYKHIRARYKHLRFAQRLYSKRHQTDRVFDKTTITLGHLQDAFRSGRRGRILRYGIKLRLLLTLPMWAWVHRSLRRTRLDSATGLRAYQLAEMHRLKEALERPAFAGHEFHMVRKIVSQYVSFYDTLRSLAPSEDAYRMSRFLAAINGLMGARHDEMVTEALSGRTSYSQPVPLANEIRRRLETLVARYPF
jgi:hypothetical protein